MSTSLLTPRMRGLLDRVARADRPLWHQMTPQSARAAYERAAEVLDLPRVPLARVEDCRIPTASGVECAARLYAASGQELPVLLYLHGGGFTIGSLETHDSLCRQLAQRAGVALLALDYRLAPEHPFPAAVEDACGALRWLFGHAQTLGLDPRRVAIGGDSAGATLSAVAAIVARDEGLPLALQLLITPGTAARGDTASRHLFARGFLLDADTIDWFFDQYLDARHRHDWRFAPLEAPDLEGVAPAWFGLAECDPLVDEGMAYADRLRMAGVAVDLDIYRGVTHDFIKLGRALPEAGEAQAAAAAALRRALLD